MLRAPAVNTGAANCGCCVGFAARGGIGLIAVNCGIRAGSFGFSQNEEALQRHCIFQRGHWW